MVIKAVKSAAVTAGTAGCCLGQVVTPAPAPTSPLATLAHVGEPSEAEGRRVEWVGWRVAGPAGWPTIPCVGVARWRRPWQVDRAASLFPAPTPAPGGGGQVADQTSEWSSGGGLLSRQRLAAN